MVLVPTRPPPVASPHEPAQAPHRPDHVAPPPSDGGERLPWRAVVHPGQGDAVQTSWHLAGCAAPLEAGAHCPEGQRLFESLGEPDGHCLVDGICVRCAAVTAVAQG